MPVSKHQILASLAAIEKQAPLFFGDMPVADDVIRDVYASAMAGLPESPDFRRATPRCREVALLAALTHALLEAAALRQQLRRQDELAVGEAGRLIVKIAAH